MLQAACAGVPVQGKHELAASKHEWVIFMGEIGPPVTGTGAPQLIMSGMGTSGSESAVEKTYMCLGFDGIKAMINTTLPAFSMKLGETARLNIINVGDQVHNCGDDWSHHRLEVI